MEIVQTRMAADLFSVKDKVVMVIGAGGLGEYLARGMAENGAEVIITNTSIQKAERIKGEMEADGLHCGIYKMNVTDNDEIAEVVRQIVEQYGRIDVLINTAGIGAHSSPEDYPPNVVKQVIDVNLNGTIYTNREVGKVMIAQGGGKIINIGSIAGNFCHTFLSMPYECSKAAVHQFTRSLAATWAKYHINVNCIAPTWMYTPMLEGMKGDFFATLIEQHPAGRLASVNDFMGTALFLASDASNFVTGQTIFVDGGWSCGKPVDIPVEQRCVRE